MQLRTMKLLFWKGKTFQFFYKFFLTFILHCDIIITVNHIGKQKEGVIYELL